MLPDWILIISMKTAAPILACSCSAEIFTCVSICSVRWSVHWFKLELDIPECWLEEEVRLQWDSVTEAMVWKNGEPVQVV